MRKLVILLLSIHLNAFASDADIWVISHKVNQELTLTKQQVRQVYLGKSIVISNLIISQPLMLNKQSNVRRTFNATMLGLTEARLQSYWARMRFSGRSSAPMEVENIQQMFDFIISNKEAIGYVPSGIALPNDVVVIYP